MAGLAERGHRIHRVGLSMGGAQAIRVNLDSGLLEGGSVQRKDGVGVGGLIRRGHNPTVFAGTGGPHRAKLRAHGGWVSRPHLLLAFLTDD